MQVRDQDGNIICDERSVLERWKIDFSNLYNGCNSDEFEQGHYDRTKVHKHLFELNIADPLYTSNSQLNHNISIERISFVIMTTKSKSTADNIP
jgi:hypothetical protein